MNAIGIYVIVAVFLCALTVFVASYSSLWLQAYFAGTRIGLLDLVLMSLRNSNPRTIVQCKVMAVQSGLEELSTSAIEAQYLSGGDVHRVTRAVIAANRAGISLDWKSAAAIDLAGRDIMEAVRASVNPEVIDCPDPKSGGGNTLCGVSKDGIQLIVRVRVTVRMNLLQLVGGAMESTIVARIGQSVISAIGACNSYRDVLFDPEVIIRQVNANPLNSQTAFDIVSIDIACIEVGTNIGAILRIDQADADVRVARAVAEKRRTMALARQQEMKGGLAKSRALLMLAEAKIPAAIAMALRSGQVHSHQLKRGIGTRVIKPKPFTSDNNVSQLAVGIQFI